MVPAHLVVVSVTYSRTLSFDCCPPKITPFIERPACMSPAILRIAGSALDAMPTPNVRVESAMSPADLQWPRLWQELVTIS
jgi:hypothetical protein